VLLLTIFPMGAHEGRRQGISLRPKGGRNARGTDAGPTALNIGLESG
jgi:hypothetical protein